MTDLFRKLNLLLRTNLPDLTPGGEAKDEPPRLGKNVDREIAALNDRVRDAYAYEAQLKARIETLQADIYRLDEEADAAIADGREEQARYHIEQMKRAQARLEMTQADLREHQRVTAELVMRVRELEDAVARAREAQAAPPQPPAERPSLEDSLRATREELDSAPPDERLSSGSAPARPKPSTGDDLDDRIRRLSK
jgi:chromosome segregation ATPase